MKEVIGQQGEVVIRRIDKLPEGMVTKPVEKLPKGWVISHSESGNHHILTGGDVMERTDSMPEGLRKLYAILDEPAMLIQDASRPHEGFLLPAGIYEFPLSRRFDSMTQQAKRVAD